MHLFLYQPRRAHLSIRKEPSIRHLRSILTSAPHSWLLPVNATLIYSFCSPIALLMESASKHFDCVFKSRLAIRAEYMVLTAGSNPTLQQEVSLKQSVSRAHAADLVSCVFIATAQGPSSPSPHRCSRRHADGFLLHPGAATHSLRGQLPDVLTLQVGKAAVCRRPVEFQGESARWTSPMCLSTTTTGPARHLCCVPLTKWNIISCMYVLSSGI